MCADVGIRGGRGKRGRGGVSRRGIWSRNRRRMRRRERKNLRLRVRGRGGSGVGCSGWLGDACCSGWGVGRGGTGLRSAVWGNGGGGLGARG